MDEFSIISKYIAPLASDEKGAFGLKDDAAIIPLPKNGYQQVVTKDAILEGTHFLHDTNPRDIAYKILGINLSDIASMGAEAKYYFMSAILNKTCDEEWISNFTNQLSILQSQYNITLMGGDTIFHDGKINLSLTMIGEVKPENILLRSGAKVGDNIYVTGTIGDSAIGLYILQNEEFVTNNLIDTDYLISRYLKPQPRTDIATLINKFASSATDISDGLMADMENICKASNVGAEILEDRIPVSNEANMVLSVNNDLHELVYSGGDDYELLFTVSDEFEEEMLANIKLDDHQITRIGQIVEGGESVLLNSSGVIIDLVNKGYTHNP